MYPGLKMLHRDNNEKRWYHLEGREMEQIISERASLQEEWIELSGKDKDWVQK